jgi:hypothetical protein
VNPFLVVADGGGVPSGRRVARYAYAPLSGPGSFTPNVGLAELFVDLPDGGRDGRCVGIFLGWIDGGVVSACAEQDGGKRFAQAVSIIVTNFGGVVDGGRFLFHVPPDGGLFASLAVYGDAGYLNPLAFGGGGSITLNPLTDAGLGGTFTAALIAPKPGLIDAGTLSGTISVPVCP